MLFKNQLLEKDIYNRNIPFAREKHLTRLGIILVMTLIGINLSYSITNIIQNGIAGNIRFVFEEIVLILIFSMFNYGNLVYLISRSTYMGRLEKYSPAEDDELNEMFQNETPSLTILVPSYKEDKKVISQTLLSAGLQEYPNKRVVLLIDDSPFPQDEESSSLLENARRLPDDICDMFKAPFEAINSLKNHFHKRTRMNNFLPSYEILCLQSAFRTTAEWFNRQAEKYPVEDHTDRLFVEKIFREQGRRFWARAEEIAHLGLSKKGFSLKQQIMSEYNRLIAIFSVEMTTFERKQFDNLSHEANKAMNLNSYISLMGKSLKMVEDGHRFLLEETDFDSADFVVPESDYIINLDADSLIVPQYALRLIHKLEQPEHRRTAIAQTPYSAVPGAQSKVERAAGIYTDMLYILHQGVSKFSAAYWIGANCLVRYEALKDIRTVITERGYEVDVFIQDKTVIEDTESSLDLRLKGWSLYNYPRRLAYSATPVDFGSLVIQRRRWANGGLILFEKLMKFFKKSPEKKCLIQKGMLIHHLISFLGGNVSILLLLFYPFAVNANYQLLLLMSLPYFFFYGRDILQAGYTPRDFFKVYAGNLLLLPVNLSGVIKSIQQMFTKKKIPFKRTPKIQTRVTAPGRFVFFHLLCFVFFLVKCVAGFMEGTLFTNLFLILNTFAFGYIISTFIGLRESIEDLFGLKPAVITTKIPKGNPADIDVEEEPELV